MARILRYAKFAEESEFAESPAPSPDITVDIASANMDTPSDTQQIWDGGIGRGQRLHRPGYYSTSGNVVVAVDVHTVAWFLRWALGGYAYTSEGGDGDLHLHEFWGVTDTVLPTFATWLGKDVFEHRFEGCSISQLQLEVSDGYAQVTLDLVGGRDARETIDQSVLDQLPLPPPD